jgi:hypothetical protein
MKYLSEGGEQQAPAQPNADPAMAPGQSPQAVQDPTAGPPTTVPGTEAETVKKYEDRAVEILYSERFDPMIKMFETNGAPRFANSMATALNTVISEMEKEGPIPPLIAAAVMLKVFHLLLEDLSVSTNTVEGVTEEAYAQSLIMTIDMYAASHKDTVTPDDVQAMKQALAQEFAKLQPPPQGGESNGNV